jgi:carboxymethylenebutenolidase
MIRRETTHQRGEENVGKTLELTAADGFKLSAYRADPSGKPKGAIVVIQEIFGVNHHIRNVTDKFAAEGYVAIAPALFDRAQRGVEVGYDAAGIATGREMRGKITDDQMLADTQAAIDAVADAGKVAVVGYCLGGTIAYLSATRLKGIAAAVGYYGGGIAATAAEKTKVPVMLHFGDADQGIPLTDVDKIKAAHPEIPVHIYHAGHGFSCDERGSFEPESAKVAFGRTMEFLGQHLK